MVEDGGSHRGWGQRRGGGVGTDSAIDSSMALTVTDLKVKFMVTSPRNTAKTPILFGIRAKKIIPIFQAVGAGGNGGFG
jgi:hypothetical protein